MAWAERPDGTAYVRERSTGELTELVYGALMHQTTVTFVPTGDYTLDDVADTLERHAAECHIVDIEHALTFWGVPFTAKERNARR